MLIRQSKLCETTNISFFLFLIEIEASLQEVSSSEFKVYHFMLHLINKLAKMEGTSEEDLELDG